MTIHIRYEYKCDFCGGEIFQPEEYTINPHIHTFNGNEFNHKIPYPRMGYGIGERHACHRCINAANSYILGTSEEVGHFFRVKDDTSVG